MTHMIDDNENFAELLQDYMADTPDAGFSAAVQAGIIAQDARLARVKRNAILAACLLAATIMSMLIIGSGASLPSLTLTSLMESLLWPTAGLTILGFALWALDNGDFVV